MSSDLPFLFLSILIVDAINAVVVRSLSCGLIFVLDQDYQKTNAIKKPGKDVYKNRSSRSKSAIFRQNQKAAHAPAVTERYSIQLLYIL